MAYAVVGQATVPLVHCLSAPFSWRVPVVGRHGTRVRDLQVHIRAARLWFLHLNNPLALMCTSVHAPM